MAGASRDQSNIKDTTDSSVRAIPWDPMEESLRVALAMQLEEIGVTESQKLCNELVPSSVSEVAVQASKDQLLARQLWLDEVRMRTDEKFAVSLARQDYGVMTDDGFSRQVSEFNEWKAKSLKDGTSKPDALFDCGVCMERLDKTKHQFQRLPCQHAFCLRCVRHYIAVSVEQGNLEILCPDPDCKTTLDMQRIAVIMAGCGPVYNVLQKAILTKDLRESTLYCANKACSESFVVADREDLNSKQTCLFTCPWCFTVTCGQCKRTDHGEGPCPTDVDELDKMMRQASLNEGWKECPECKTVIEKRDDDCNYVRCRCGCAFCYHCSTPYKNTFPTKENEHGTPACKCGLFVYPVSFD